MKSDVVGYSTDYLQLPVTLCALRPPWQRVLLQFALSRTVVNKSD